MGRLHDWQPAPGIAGAQHWECRRCTLDRWFTPDGRVVFFDRKKRRKQPERGCGLVWVRKRKGKLHARA